MKQSVIRLMGTRITLQIEHPKAEVLLSYAEEMLKDYERRFSANDNTSDLMRVNQNAGIQPVQVDEDLFELIEHALAVSLSSDSKFNLTIGPLVKLWKIGFKDAQLPSDAEIQERLQKIQPENVELDHEAHTVYLKIPGMEIDLGAIAKGYFADQLKAYFVSQGVQTGIIDLGGNVLTIGHPLDKEKWTVGIQQPESERGQMMGVIEIEGQSVVTSGIYERYFYKDGRLYHHILDSKTGYPAEGDIASITIVSDQSIDGEIWTTVCFAMSIQQAISVLNEIPGIEAVIISKENKVFKTQRMTHLTLL
ncbi:FAD:protein FMN transferase [Staphylococcus simulans]|uniref:FAD:protein FMN transferase n=1 Tax=Staphylococcus simulans TaxID=1286 RepID=UPI000D047E19|nr:FAD:protein FMN transferase [Staphylococcus simulans]